MNKRIEKACLGANVSIEDVERFTGLGMKYVAYQQELKLIVDHMARMGYDPAYIFKCVKASREEAMKGAGLKKYNVYKGA